jgi:anti-sigma-K factor RskA
MPRDADLTDVHALAGAYALDALSEFERAAFDHHLAGCESCALEVAELAETAARLTDLTQEAPPSWMRDAVLGDITRTPQERGGRSRGETRTAHAAVRRWRRWTAAAVAAGVIAVGAAVGTWAVDQQRVRDARAEAGQLRDLLAAPDVRVRTMAVAGGQVTVLVSPSRDAGVAVLDHLSAPGDGKAYELWLIRGDKPEPAGTLAAGERDATRRLEQIGDARKFAVSVERAGGSPTNQPTQVLGVLEL